MNLEALMSATLPSSKQWNRVAELQIKKHDWLNGRQEELKWLEEVEAKEKEDKFFEAMERQRQRQKRIERKRDGIGQYPDGYLCKAELEIKS